MWKRSLSFSFTVFIIALVASPALAQTDHADIARAAFEASALPPPPRTVESALPFITRLLAMLPAGEKAGYVRGPQGGENVWPLSDGTLVRISRVMYPNGQIYKVMSDAPNGNPQWVAEDVRPDLYVAFGGSPVVTPPPVVVVPPVVESVLPVALDIQRLANAIYAFEVAHESAEKQRADALAAQLKAHDESPSWLGSLIKSPYFQIISTAIGTYFTTRQVLK